MRVTCPCCKGAKRLTIVEHDDEDGRTIVTKPMCAIVRVKVPCQRKWSLTMMDGYWAVAQCEAQRDRIARTLLAKAAFETYAPCFRSKADKIVLLFPSYIFVRITARWYPVAWCPGVIRVLMCGDRPAQLSEQIVESIRRREVDGLVKLPSAGRRLRKGDHVRITRGSFEGQIGIYDGMTARERERVLLELLGAWVPVELASTDVAPVVVNQK